MNTVQNLDAIFGALSDNTRRRILTFLLEEDLTISEIAARFDHSLAATSKHIAVLSEAGLVRKQRKGRITTCELEPDSLADAMVWMESFGYYEASSLENLEDLLASSGE